ncbi:hypothetical protein PI125_g20074 [Phytophthora idaei]|nr:hypothetical protein PI125_g20074 [Phytophthora idaei]KAG3130403.1 hypothetical protein PI126_g20527 [Phytophthora idaei]
MDGLDGESTVATVRARLTRNAVTPVEISVAAVDDEQGIFVPAHNRGVVLLAATTTAVMNKKALVSAINMRGDYMKLPSKKELGKSGYHLTRT